MTNKDFSFKQEGCDGALIWENSFNISFSALDYSEHERIYYSYMLEGFDNYWIECGQT